MPQRPSRLVPLRRTFAAVFLAAAIALGGTAAAQPPQPFAQTSILGFTDINGNGVLDCGEPVQIVAAFTTGNGTASAVTGTLAVPAAGTTGLDFEPGSLVIDPILTVGCQALVTRGDASGDTAGLVSFTCPPDPLDNNAWIVVVRYNALFAGTTPSYNATAEATLTGGPSYDAGASGTAPGAVCTGSAPAALTITKTAAGPASLGSTLLYTLAVTDTSGLGQGGLQLVDTVPAGTTFDAAASSPGWTCAAGGAAGALCRYPLGNVTPDGSAAAYFAVQLAATYGPGATIANTACVRLGPDIVAACASATTPVQGTPLLHLGKTLTSGTGAPGTDLTYTLTAANTGNQGLSDVQLSETVPANTTAANGAASGWTCAAAGAAGAACTLDLGPLAAGATLARTFTVLVADPLPALPPGAAITNTACLAATGSGTAPELRDHNSWRKKKDFHPSATARAAGLATSAAKTAAGAPAAAAVAPSCATVATPVDGTPSLSLMKTLKAGSSAAPGGTLAYDLAVANAGNEGAAAVTLSETVPVATTFGAVASTAGWTCTPGSAAGSTCTLALGTVAAGSTLHATFAVTIDDPLAAGVQAVANTACARWGTAAPACDTLTTPTAGQVRLTLTKTAAGGPVTAGAVVVFHLAAANTGDQGAAAVTLGETVPAATTFDPADSTPGWTCAPGPAAGAACTLALGPLAAGGAATALFAVRAADPLPAGLTQIANAACVQAAGGAQACGQATTPPAAALAGELRATFATDANHDGLAETGDRLLYTLTVTNTTAATAHQLVLATPLDPHLTLDVGSVLTSAGAVTAGNQAGDTVPTVAVAALAPGAAVTVTFTATVGPLPAGLRILSTQSLLTGADVPATVSDDPDTPAPLDPTTTPVGTAGVTPAGIPTLSGWGMILLALALAVVSGSRLRPRRPFDRTPVPLPAAGTAPPAPGAAEDGSRAASGSRPPAGTQDPAAAPGADPDAPRSQAPAHPACD